MTTENKKLKQSFRNNDVSGVQQAFGASANASLGEVQGRGLFREALENSTPEMQEAFVEAFIAELADSKKLDLNYLGAIFDTLKHEKFDLAENLLEGLNNAEDLQSALHLLPIKMKSLEEKGSEVGANLVAKALVDLHRNDANALREKAALLSQQQDTYVESSESQGWMPPSLSKIFMSTKNRKLARAIESNDISEIDQSLKDGATPLTFNGTTFTPSLLERALYSSPPEIKQQLAKSCADQGLVDSGYFTALSTAAKTDIECLGILLEGVEKAENSEEAFTYLGRNDIEEAANDGRYNAAAMMAKSLANIHETYADKLSKRQPEPQIDAELAP